LLALLVALVLVRLGAAILPILNPCDQARPVTSVSE